ncbi:MAG: dienelactone hydrolase family protein [Cyanobacteria bacterium SZAS-4]|nr:dienelactone hydrolase family protein [Cyanobacteria bacterium SZAS-4]
MSIKPDAILELAYTDLSGSAKAAYEAFKQELHGGYVDYRSLYTRTAAQDKALPDFELVDPEHPNHIGKPGDHKEQLTVNGISREYTVHVPPQYDGTTKLPVVVMLHGHGEDGQQFADLSQINAEADKKGFIAVYPDAVQWFGEKNQSAWNANDGLVPPGTNVDDVQFVNSIIDTTAKQLPVDSDRVFVAGYSNGGMLAAEVANKLSDKVAAVGLVSTGMSDANETTDGSPISVVSIHGTDDPLIPICGFPKVPKTLNRLGLPQFESYDDATDYWVSKDGASQPLITKDGNVTKADYQNGKNGTEVAQYTVSGGNHAWYGSEGSSGANASINATEVLWDFFQAHPKQAYPN